MISPARLRTLTRFAALAFPKLVKMLSVLLVDALIARHLGTEEFGLYSLLLAVFMTLAILVKFGLDNVLVRDTVSGRLGPKRIAQVWTVRVGAALVGQAAFIGIAMVVPMFHDYLWHLVLVSFGFVVLGLSTFEPQMQGDERFGLLGASQTAIIVAGAAVKLYFLANDASVEMYWLSLAVEALVSAAITVAYLLRTRRLPNVAAFSGVVTSAVRGYAREGLPFLLGGLSVIAFMRIDQFMLAAFAGTGSVGTYSAALRISEAFFALATLASSVIFPNLVRLKMTSASDYEEVFVRTLRLSLIAALTITVGLTLFATPIVRLVYGPSYHNSALLLALHSWVMLPAFWGVVTHRWLVAEHLGKYDFYRNLAGLGANVAGNLVLIPLYGAAGACIVTILAQFVSYIGINAVLGPLRPLARLQLNAVKFS